MKTPSLRCQLRAPCGLWSRTCQGQTKVFWPSAGVVFKHLQERRS